MTRPPLKASHRRHGVPPITTYETSDEARGREDAWFLGHEIISFFSNLISREV
jgi:hypothetical protein